MKKFVDKHKNLILYGVIGAFGSSLDFLFYYLFIRFASLEPALASFVSVSIGILNSFVLNAIYNFKVNNHILRRFAIFYLTGLSGALISTALIFLLYNILHISAILSKLITVVPVVLLQYYINKNISFRRYHTRN